MDEVNEKLTDVERKTKISQAYFNPVMNYFYDFFLYRFVSEYFWGCKTSRLIDRYKQNAKYRHLEVGAGTGFLLDKYNPKDIDLTLMDLSQSFLDKSSRRLIRYTPKLLRQNILYDIPWRDNKFYSISVNYVMHCVVGDFKSKGIAFRHLKSLLTDDGVLYGVTVLKTPKSSFVSKLFMGLLNISGVFNCRLDNADDLERELNKVFDYVCVDLASSAALFFATDSEIEFNLYQVGVRSNG